MVKKFDVTITPFELDRTIHLYLPDDYEESEERYPVIYMYDGHNLFSDEDATYGKSWGLVEFLENYDKKFIIVGIECNHEGNQRLCEFSPYSFSSNYFGHIKGKGKVLMDWVVNELKPMIDNEYRTLPERESTAIAGSSMGGLMALYTILKHNQTFSKAACVSSAISLCLKQIKHDMKNVKIVPETKVYLSFGTNETDNVDLTLNRNVWFHNLIVKQGARCMVNVVKDGYHCEAAWEKENPVYFDFLWK